MRTLLLFLPVLALVACGGSSEATAESKEAAHAEGAEHPHGDHDKMAGMDHSKMAGMDHDKKAPELKYSCADAPDTVLDRPGKCADGTLAKAVLAEGQTAEYFCPMHPDTVQGDPGKCGECGMFLSARLKGADAPAGGMDMHKGMDMNKAAPAKTN